MGHEPSRSLVRKETLLLMAEIRLYNQLRLVVYPIIYKVLYIPGGCLEFLPSTVGQDKNLAKSNYINQPKFLSKCRKCVFQFYDECIRMSFLKMPK